MKLSARISSSTCKVPPTNPEPAPALSRTFHHAFFLLQSCHANKPGHSALRLPWPPPTSSFLATPLMLLRPWHSWRHRAMKTARRLLPLGLPLYKAQARSRGSSRVSFWLIVTLWQVKDSGGGYMKDIGDRDQRWKWQSGFLSTAVAGGSVFMNWNW